jgi:CHASE2 domain-containing sensor protein
MTAESQLTPEQATSPSHPVRDRLPLVRRVRRPQFWIAFAVALTVVLISQDRLESLFESDEDSFVGQEYFRLTRLYHLWVARERFPVKRYTAIVEIDRDKDKSVNVKDQGDIPHQRLMMAKLICRVHTATPAVIVVDKYFGTKKYEGRSTDVLRSAIDSVTRDTVVVVGKLVDEGHPVSTKAGNRYFFSPSLPFGIQSSRFQEGVVNVDPDTRKVPLRWEVYENKEQAEKSTGAPEWHETLPLLASLAYPDRLVQKNRPLSSLIERNENPFTSLLKEDDFEPILAGQILDSGVPARRAEACPSEPLPEVLQKQIAGRVVVIGEIDHQNDDHFTVLGKMSGLLLQANYIESLLDDRVFRSSRILDYFFGVLVLAVLHASILVFHAIWMEEVVAKSSSTLAKSIIPKKVAGILKALLVLALAGISLLLIGFALFLIVQLARWYVDPAPLGIIPVATEILGILFVAAAGALTAGSTGPGQGTSNS